MIYVVLFLISFTLTYFIKEYAIKKSLVAAVNERSSHTVPTPHGGGIALALTWFIGLGYFYFINEIDSTLFYALMFGVIISVVSFFDDIYELSSKLRFLVQAFVAFVGLYLIGGWESFSFGIFTVENQFLTNAFGIFMIVGFINLYNFLDGINGYAGSEAIFLSVSGFLLFGGEHFLVLAAATLGFLYWNFGNCAKIFMGDVGSTLLGYNIAIFTIYYTNQEVTNFWIWIILFGVFWFDATVTLIRRKLNGEKITQAHKKHAYQRLTQAGWSHTKVTLYALGLNVVIFALVYFIPNVAISFALSLVLLYGAMKFVDSKKKFE